jgi:hypothetical protein
MKRQAHLLIVLASITFCSGAYADISGTPSFQFTDANLSGTLLWHPVKGDTGILDIGSLSSRASQIGAGGLNGTVNTDTADDPTLGFSSFTVNESTFDWAGYRVNVSMAVPFTFSAVTVDNYSGGTMLSDWSPHTTVTPPTWNGAAYVGQIDYLGGTTVAVGDELDFSYRVSFSGQTSYAVAQQYTPIPVPEPGLMGLATMGLLFGAVKLNRRGNRNS